MIKNILKSTLCFVLMALVFVSCDKDPYENPTIAGSFRVLSADYLLVTDTGNLEKDTSYVEPLIHLFFMNTGELVQYVDGMEVSRRAYEILHDQEPKRLIISQLDTALIEFTDSVRCTISTKMSILDEPETNQIQFVYELGP